VHKSKEKTKLQKENIGNDFAKYMEM